MVTYKEDPAPYKSKVRHNIFGWEGVVVYSNVDHTDDNKYKLYCVLWSIIHNPPRFEHTLVRGSFLHVTNRATLEECEWYLLTQMPGMGILFRVVRLIEIARYLEKPYAWLMAHIDLQGLLLSSVSHDRLMGKLLVENAVLGIVRGSSLQADAIKIRDGHVL